MCLGFITRCAVVLLLALASTAVAGPTAWNTKISTGRGAPKQNVTLFGDHPDQMMPDCRCVTGTWKLATRGESQKYFSGVLQSPTFNHPRAAKRRLAVKIRKTRELMGIHADYRAALHEILRSEGQLVLREVTGGAWEVVGYAQAPVGALFANNPRWAADQAPAPGTPSPLPDAAKDAAALANAINDYRAGLGLPRVPISRSLTKVAEAHVRDLNDNKPTSSTCNMHSWSDDGPWSACCYDKSMEAARCMWIKPKEIAKFRGNGYEIAANASGITVAKALELWQRSTAHHDVMINRGKWKQRWGSLGVAIHGDYAVAWFANEADR